MTNADQRSYDEIAATLLAQWEAGDTAPDLAHLLLGSATLSLDETVELFLTDQPFRWRSPEPCRVEDYLKLRPAIAEQSDLVLELAYGELRIRRQLGQPATPDEIEARFPAVAPQLQEQLELGKWLDGRNADAASDAQPSPFAAVPLRGRFGVYDLEEVIAHGGMGVVYRARDLRLNRPVALKVIRSDRLNSNVDLRRFQNESLTIAQLDHAHIVPLYDVGQVDGVHYYTMKLMEGGDLQKKARRYLENPRAAAQVLADVADAVHHAHQRGVLHRDLKPSNVLLDEHGGAHVSDFGLAARLDAHPHLTASGELLGTPAFIAPETVAHERGPFTVAADVYGLGAVLYVLLTGVAPFGDQSLIPMLESIRHSDPQPPRRVNPLVPADLEQICQKALAKQPRDRYASVQDLADDLQRFLDGRPVHARPLAWWQQRWRWIQKHPDLAGIAGMILAAAAVLLGLLAIQSRRLNSTRESLDGAVQQAATQLDQARTFRRQAEAGQRDLERLRESAEELEAQAQAARTAALAQETLARETSYGTAVLRGELALRSGDTVEFSRLMDAQRPMPGQPDVRGFEWFLLDHLYRPAPTEYSVSAGAVRCIRFTPDGKRIAVAGDAPLMQILESDSGQVRVSWDSPTTVRSLALSPDGQSLAAAGDDGHLRIYPFAGGAPREFLVSQTAVINVAYLGDGARLVTCDRNGSIRVLHSSTGEVLATPAGLSSDIECIVPSPEGRWLFSGHGDGGLKVWDLETSQVAYQFSTGETRQIKCLAISQDGRFLATGGVDKYVRVAALEQQPWSHAWKWKGGHYERLYSVAFSADGRRVASSDKNGSVRVWKRDGDPENGAGNSYREEFSWQAHQGRAYDVAFTPQGETLATGGPEPHVALWTLRPQGDGLSLQQTATKTRPDRSIAFTSDSQLLAVATNDGVQLWNVATRQLQQRLARGGPAREHVSLSSDGQYLATSSNEGRIVELWRNSPQGFQFAWEATDQTSDQLSFSTTADVLAVASWQAGEVALYDSATGQLERRIHADQCAGVEFSPDGRLMAFTELDDAVVWDWSARQPLFRLHEHWNTVRSVSFSPSGRQLATGAGDRRIVLWDSSTGRPTHIMMGNRAQVIQIVFVGEDRLISLDENGVAMIWDAKLGMLLCSLRELDANHCYRLAVSPDQRWLACHLANGFIQFFPLNQGADRNARSMGRDESAPAPSERVNPGENK